MSDEARNTLRAWLGITTLEDALADHEARLRVLELAPPPDPPSPPAEPPPAPEPSAYATTPNPGTSARVQTLATATAGAWERLFTGDIRGRSYTVPEAAASKAAYDARNLTTTIHALAHAVHITRDPRLTRHANDLITLMMQAQTLPDPWGHPMYDPNLDAGGRKGNWYSMALNDAIAHSILGTLIRIARDNGGEPEGAVDYLRACWRRYGRGAWSYGTGDFSTADPDYPLAHDDPDTSIRDFSHTNTSLAVVGWHLHKLTGEPAYARGTQRILDWFAGGSGAEQGITPARASWQHRPHRDQYAQSNQYNGTTFGNLSLLHLEGGLPASLPLADFQRGIAHFVWRDAGVRGVRSCVAGGTDTESPVITARSYGTNEPLSITRGGSLPFSTAYEWFARAHFVAMPAIPFAQQVARQAEAGGSTDWTRGLGLQAGLLLTEAGYGT